MFKNFHSKSLGFIDLWSVTMGLSLILLAIMFGSKYISHKQQIIKHKHFAQKIKLIISQVQKFQYDKVKFDNVDSYAGESYPTFDTLQQNGIYWVECSIEDENNNLCNRADSTSFSTTKMILTTMNQTISGREVFIGVLKIPLSMISSSSIYNGYLNELKKISNMKIQPNNDVWFIIDAAVNSKAYQSFLKRDGSTKLSKAWDAGGEYGIFNLPYLTIKNVDNTQKRLGAGVVYSFVAKSGYTVLKNSFSCPIDLTRSISVQVHSIEALTPDNDFYNLSSFRPYFTETPTSWIVKLDYHAILQKDNQWAMLHDGYLKVDLLCQQK